MLEYLLLFEYLTPVIIRVVLGAAFIAHGYPKLFKTFPMFAGFLDSIGIRPGKFWALVVGTSEFFGGIALILGILTQVVAILIIVDMIVAMAKVKWGAVGYAETERNGWELDLAYLAMAAALLVTGPGAYALDGFRFLGY